MQGVIVSGIVLTPTWNKKELRRIKKGIRSDIFYIKEQD